MNDSLRPKAALVVGASGGLGRATTAMLAGMGYRLALLARDRERLVRTRAELALPGSPLLLSADVTDRAQVQAAVAEAERVLGSVDVLVIAAGLNVKQRSLRSLDPADWDQVIASNLTGAYNVLHFVLPLMRNAGGGLVVQISSLSGMRANVVSGAAYSAAKFAQSALGLCIGREERGRGIRSTVLYAGEVNTEFLNARSDRPGGAMSDQRRQAILQPDDIAAAILFLVDLPKTAHVPELVLKPTIDDFS
jgi:NADP-dependent 3-hydroxy acid dehydrogenase YdfG